MFEYGTVCRNPVCRIRQTVPTFLSLLKKNRQPVPRIQQIGFRQTGFRQTGFRQTEHIPYVHLLLVPELQERSEAERRAIWPCLNVATRRREQSDRDIQAGTLIHSLYNVHRNIVRTSQFHLERKKAKVITVFKKGSQTKVKNYRPIILLNFCSKFFENIFERLLDIYTPICRNANTVSELVDHQS